MIRALTRLGSGVPPKYVELLAGTPLERTIPGISPWAFDKEPETAIEFCSRAVGRPVLPFAQAVGEDLMACFETVPMDDPAVLVINPWAQDDGEWVKGEVEIARFPNFAARLGYERISESVSKRDGE